MTPRAPEDSPRLVGLGVLVPRYVNYGLKMSHSYALKVRHFKTGF